MPSESNKKRRVFEKVIDPCAAVASTAGKDTIENMRENHFMVAGSRDE